jgi:hypothetical protein
MLHGSSGTSARTLWHLDTNLSRRCSLLARMSRETLATSKAVQQCAYYSSVCLLPSIFFVSSLSSSIPRSTCCSPSPHAQSRCDQHHSQQQSITARVDELTEKVDCAPHCHCPLELCTAQCRRCGSGAARVQTSQSSSKTRENEEKLPAPCSTKNTRSLSYRRVQETSERALVAASAAQRGRRESAMLSDNESRAAEKPNGPCHG